MDLCKEKGMTKKKDDRGSNHYKEGSIEPITYILANNLGFCEGNVVKYITRYKHSGKPVEDLEKAKHYIDFLLEQEMSGESGENEYSPEPNFDCNCTYCQKRKVEEGNCNSEDIKKCDCGISGLCDRCIYIKRFYCNNEIVTLQCPKCKEYAEYSETGHSKKLKRTASFAPAIFHDCPKESGSPVIIFDKIHWVERLEKLQKTVKKSFNWYGKEVTLKCPLCNQYAKRDTTAIIHDCPYQSADPVIIYSAERWIERLERNEKKT
jgi:hypothetical protein